MVAPVTRGREAGLPVRRPLRGPVDWRRLGGGSALLHHGVPGAGVAGRTHPGRANPRDRGGRTVSRRGDRPSPRPWEGCVALRSEAGEYPAGPGPEASAGRFWTVAAVARAGPGLGDPVLHGPGTGRPEGSARRPMGRVRLGRLALLHAHRGPTPPDDRSGRATGEGGGLGSAAGVLPATDPSLPAADGASADCGGGSRLGRDRRSLPGGRSGPTVPECPGSAGRVGRAERSAGSPADDGFGRGGTGVALGRGRAVCLGAGSVRP